MDKKEDIKQKRKADNKRFAIIGLFFTIIINLIFKDLIIETYEELIRYFQNGFQPQVLKFFLGNFISWILVTLTGFFIPFGILKAISLETEKSSEEIDERIKESKEIEKRLSIDSNIGGVIGFDETNKKWVIYDKYGLIEQVYNYSDIVGFELLENGESVAEGGIKGALVGGILFGEAGAIVGSITGRKTNEICNSLKIKVTLNDISFPVTYVNLIDSEVKKSNPIYKNNLEIAQKCLSAFQLACNKQNDSKQENNKEPASDEIRKYKGLLDEGIITQEEFDKKKKELLDL